MKVISPSFLVCAGIFLATSLLSLADTVKLKSGETVEGKIFSETDQQIVMDVMVASGITDQKTIAKSDVQTVSKTLPDEIAYQSIKGHRVEPHSLPLASYPPIVNALEAFLKTYPKSSHAGEVQTTLNTFKQEQERVKAKDIKWDNRWYTPAEFERNKALIQSQMQLATMREQVARRDFISALNTFDQIEKKYPSAPAYAEAVDLAKNILRLLPTEMEHTIGAAKAQENQFNAGIVLVPEPQKSQMIAARKAQIAASEAALAGAERAGLKWKPLLPMAPKSIEALKATLATEVPRLEALSARNGAAASKQGGAALNKGSASAAAPASAANAAPNAAAPDAAASPEATPTPAPTPKPKKWYEFF